MEYSDVAAPEVNTDGSASSGTDGEGNNRKELSDAESSVSEDDEDGEEDDYITSCICGFTHNDDFMIACDRCNVWQHLVCLEIKAGDEPEVYLCDMCNPRTTLNVQKAISMQKKKLAKLMKIDKHYVSSLLIRDAHMDNESMSTLNTTSMHNLLLFFFAILSEESYEVYARPTTHSNNNNAAQPKTSNPYRKGETEVNPYLNIVQEDIYSLLYSHIPEYVNGSIFNTHSIDVGKANYLYQKRIIGGINNYCAMSGVFSSTGYLLGEYVADYTCTVRDSRRFNLVSPSGFISSSKARPYNLRIGNIDVYHPFVYFTHDPSFFLDSSVVGNATRSLRRSCRPNAIIVPYRSENMARHTVDVRYAVFALQQINPNEEITIPFDTNPEFPERLRFCACTYPQCLVNASNMEVLTRLLPFSPLYIDFEQKKRGFVNARLASRSQLHDFMAYISHPHVVLEAKAANQTYLSEYISVNYNNPNTSHMNSLVDGYTFPAQFLLQQMDLSHHCTLKKCQSKLCHLPYIDFSPDRLTSRIQPSPNLVVGSTNIGIHPNIASNFHFPTSLPLEAAPIPTVPNIMSQSYSNTNTTEPVNQATNYTQHQSNQNQPIAELAAKAVETPINYQKVYLPSTIPGEEHSYRNFSKFLILWKKRMQHAIGPTQPVSSEPYISATSLNSIIDATMKSHASHNINSSFDKHASLVKFLDPEFQNIYEALRKESGGSSSSGSNNNTLAKIKLDLGNIDTVSTADPYISDNESNSNDAEFEDVDVDDIVDVENDDPEDINIKDPLKALTIDKEKRRAQYLFKQKFNGVYFMQLSRVLESAYLEFVRHGNNTSKTAFSTGGNINSAFIEEEDIYNWALKNKISSLVMDDDIDEDGSVSMNAANEQYEDMLPFQNKRSVMTNPNKPPPVAADTNDNPSEHRNDISIARQDLDQPIEPTLNEDTKETSSLQTPVVKKISLDEYLMSSSYNKDNNIHKTDDGQVMGAPLSVSSTLPSMRHPEPANMYSASMITPNYENNNVYFSNTRQSNSTAVSVTESPLIDVLGDTASDSVDNINEIKYPSNELGQTSSSPNISTHKNMAHQEPYAPVIAKADLINYTPDRPNYQYGKSQQPPIFNPMDTASASQRYFPQDTQYNYNQARSGRVLQHTGSIQQGYGEYDERDAYYENPFKKQKHDPLLKAHPLYYKKTPDSNYYSTPNNLKMKHDSGAGALQYTSPQVRLRHQSMVKNSIANNPTYQSNYNKDQQQDYSIQSIQNKQFSASTSYQPKYTANNNIDPAPYYHPHSSNTNMGIPNKRYFKDAQPPFIPPHSVNPAYKNLHLHQQPAIGYNRTRANADPYFAEPKNQYYQKRQEFARNQQ